MAESSPAAPTTGADLVGGADVTLGDDDVRRFVHRCLDHVALEGRSVCVVVPDATRTCPLPLLLEAVHGALHGRVSKLTVLVALGTHPAMTDQALADHLGYHPDRLSGHYPGLTIMNHAWWDPATLVDVGVIPSSRVGELSGGLLRVDAPVRINRAVVEHDVVLVVGPVFPHEVVGFSGGNKYLFPGVSGPELIDVSHWLGALLTSSAIIGTLGVTPVRALIDEAAAMVATERLALCVVTRPGDARLHAAVFGTPESAWAAAAAISAETHIRYLDAPVSRVLSIVPSRYDDLWTGAKGFYKVEPVVADGGEVVIYAPHITRFSATHPEIAQIGYHCRDYFVKQWDRFSHLRWSDLAHSTHLRGTGTFDPEVGEQLRVTVTLATAIPEEVVRGANLGYLDPEGLDPGAWERQPEWLVVHDAGEDLYRLRPSG